LSACARQTVQRASEEAATAGHVHTTPQGRYALLAAADDAEQNAAPMKDDPAHARERQQETSEAETTRKEATAARQEEDAEHVREQKKATAARMREVQQMETPDAEVARQAEDAARERERKEAAAARVLEQLQQEKSDAVAARQKEDGARVREQQEQKKSIAEAGRLQCVAGTRQIRGACEVNPRRVCEINPRRVRDKSETCAR